MRIEFADAAAAADFELEGAVRVELDGPRLRLSYSGEPSTLVRALAAERIVDLEIEKASLEGIFLSLYRADEPGAPIWPQRPGARTGG